MGGIPYGVSPYGEVQMYPLMASIALWGGIPMGGASLRHKHNRKKKCLKSVKTSHNTLGYYHIL